MESMIDLNAPEFVKNRRENYRALRTNAPFAVTELDGEKVVVVTRYGDVDAIFKQPQSGVQPAVGDFPSNIGDGPAADFYRLSLPSIDAPDHTQFRRIMTPAFAPQAVSEMATWVTEIVDQRLDEISEKPAIDAVHELGHAVAVGVICKILHVPPQDGDMLTDKVNDLVHIFNQNGLTPEILAISDKAAVYIVDYFSSLLKELGDLPETDFMGALAAAERKGVIDGRQSIALIVNVLLGNYHTTVVSITNAVNAFALFPEQHRALIEQPDLAARAWEEVLRFEAPVHFRHRYVSEPFSIGDVKIEPGVRLLLGLASANWDETVFENPDTFNISRAPIRQFAFGSGRHFCLGALISRLEGRIFLPRFLSRFPDYHLTDLPHRRNEDLTFPFIERLPIEVGRSH